MAPPAEAVPVPPRKSDTDYPQQHANLQVAGRTPALLTVAALRILGSHNSDASHLHRCHRQPRMADHNVPHGAVAGVAVASRTAKAHESTVRIRHC